MLAQNSRNVEFVAGVPEGVVTVPVSGAGVSACASVGVVVSPVVDAESASSELVFDNSFTASAPGALYGLLTFGVPL